MMTSALAVLVVEDDEGLLMLACRRLERRGFRVSGARNTEQARSLLADAFFDLLVIDYQLDENMSGLDFYNELRTQGQTIPAIMCSGFSDDEHAHEALCSGIAEVLPKTEDYLDQLPDLVLRVLKH